MAIWSRLTAAIAGIGVGEAAGVALEPVLDPLKQDAWAQNTPRVLDLGTLAQLAASGLISEDSAVAEGARSGFSPDRVQRATQLALTAAPVSELLELWRRGKISETLVDHGLAKARIEPQYWTPIKELFFGRLDPAIIATAIQRGIMKDPGFLPVGPPTTAGKVATFPVSPLDPLQEAQAHGIDEARLFVETAIVGLPLSLQQAASAYFRGIIELADFQRAVSEGNTRNEWGPAALEQARQILTAAEYAELQLRGFITQKERRDLCALHGMTHADSDRLYDVLGRAPGLHAVTTGLARGGKYNGQPQTIPEPFLSAVQRQNIRPEWYSVEYANRYTYPSAFVLRSLAQEGDLGNEQAVETILLEIGWRPDLAKKVATKWTTASAATGGAKPDPWVSKAHNHLWTAVQKGYIGGSVDQPNATQSFGVIGIDPAVFPAIFQTWDEQRRIEAL